MVQPDNAQHNLAFFHQTRTAGSRKRSIKSRSAPARCCACAAFWLTLKNFELGRVDGFRKVASGGIPKSVFL
jgi:hypothetical protein